MCRDLRRDPDLRALPVSPGRTEGRGKWSVAAFEARTNVHQLEPVVEDRNSRDLREPSTEAPLGERMVCGTACQRVPMSKREADYLSGC
jgi:hypothetical protein